MVRLGSCLRGPLRGPEARLPGKLRHGTPTRGPQRGCHAGDPAGHVVQSRRFEAQLHWLTMLGAASADVCPLLHLRRTSREADKTPVAEVAKECGAPRGWLARACARRPASICRQPPTALVSRQVPPEAGFAAFWLLPWLSGFGGCCRFDSAWMAVQVCRRRRTPAVHSAWWHGCPNADARPQDEPHPDHERRAWPGIDAATCRRPRGPGPGDTGFVYDSRDRQVGARHHPSARPPVDPAQGAVSIVERRGRVASCSARWPGSAVRAHLDRRSKAGMTGCLLSCFRAWVAALPT